MKIRMLFLLFTLSSSFYVSNAQTHVFLGFQPSITVEPFYEKGEFDVNIFPLIAEKPITNRINVRIVPMLNYHFGDENTGLSDVGGSVVLPVFFRKKDSSDKQTYGFYIGPVAGYGRNLINDHYTLTLALEPGYMLRSDKRFTLTFGCQFGASHFNYDELENKWTSHFGPKISLGFWLGKL